MIRVVKSILRVVWLLVGGALFGSAAYQFMLKAQAESGVVVDDRMVWVWVVVNGLFAIALLHLAINPNQNTNGSVDETAPCK